MLCFSFQQLLGRYMMANSGVRRMDCPGSLQLRKSPQLPQLLSQCCPHSGCSGSPAHAGIPPCPQPLRISSFWTLSPAPLTKGCRSPHWFPLCYGKGTAPGTVREMEGLLCTCPACFRGAQILGKVLCCRVSFCVWNNVLLRIPFLPQSPNQLWQNIISLSITLPPAGPHTMNSAPSEASQQLFQKGASSLDKYKDKADNVWG